jgi:protease-4
MIFSLILLVLLVISLASRFLSVQGMGLGGARPMQGLQEVLVEDRGAKRAKIAIVDVEGMITGTAIDGRGRNMVALIRDQLERAADDPTVGAVVLKVDSPGGEVLASGNINRAVQEFQEKTGKPVVASMGALAASGGYYVSAPCRWIVANELTITGSIGVIMQSFNYRQLMDKVGIRPQVFKSGRFKDMLGGYRDLEEETMSPEDKEQFEQEKQMVQEMVDETFAKFRQVVKTGREYAAEKNGDKGRALVENWEEYADGRILTGNRAYELGYVDELGNFDTAVDRAEALAGISNANLVRYQPPLDLGSLLRWFVESDTPALKVELGMKVPELKAGGLYFLSNTVLH